MQKDHDSRRGIDAYGASGTCDVTPNSGSVAFMRQEAMNSRMRVPAVGRSPRAVRGEVEPAAHPAGRQSGGHDELDDPPHPVM